MKWSEEDKAKLTELCVAGTSNAELARIFGCTTADIYAARSRMGITIAKVAGKAVGVRGADGTYTGCPKGPDPGLQTPATLDKDVASAFEKLNEKLIIAGAQDNCPINHANVYFRATELLVVVREFIEDVIGGGQDGL